MKSPTSFTSELSYEANHTTCTDTLRRIDFRLSHGQSDLDDVK